MKKTRVLSALMAAVLLAVCFAVPAHASQVYFTSVNNTLLSLNASTMPLVDGGFVYIPYSIFNDSTLGTIAVYNKDTKIAAVYAYSTQKEMYFDLGSDTAYDEESRSYSVSALYRNGTAYVPAAFVCQYFGLNYSYITDSEIAVIIRIKVNGMLDDHAFATAAASRMKIELAQYERDNAASPTPSASISPVPTASQEPNPPDYSAVEVRLAFYGLDAELTPDIMDLLGRYGYKACFFLTDNDILRFPHLVRMLINSGHQLGLLSVENDNSSRWDKAASALRRTAMTKTLLAASVGEDDISAAWAAERNGLILCFDENTIPMSALNGFTQAREISSIEEDEVTVELVFQTDSEVIAELAGLLSVLKIGKFQIVQIRETLYE